MSIGALIRHGANPLLIDSKGNTPLHTYISVAKDAAQVRMWADVSSLFKEVYSGPPRTSRSIAERQAASCSKVVNLSLEASNPRSVDRDVSHTTISALWQRCTGATLRSYPELSYNAQ